MWWAGIRNWTNNSKYKYAFRTQGKCPLYYSIEIVKGIVASLMCHSHGDNDSSVTLTGTRDHLSSSFFQPDTRFPYAQRVESQQCGLTSGPTIRPADITGDWSTLDVTNQLPTLDQRLHRSTALDGKRQSRWRHAECGIFQVPEAYTRSSSQVSWYQMGRHD